MSRIYIFDAVHTVLKPVPDVIRCYYEAGKQHGSSLTRPEVKRRFRDASSRLFALSHSAAETAAGSQVSSDQIEFQLWESLIGEVFVDVAKIEPLFQQLWEYFASPQSWQLYDDVASSWQSLADRGERLVIASNFDSRLHEIVKLHSVFSLAEAVFCSAEVGFRKPDPMFYQQVADRLSLGPQEEVIMVGDDFENDYEAPRLFGWQAFHLDRRHGTEPDRIGKGTISSLSQLL